MRLQRLDALIALLLSTATVFILTLSVPQIGLTWDEPAYIAASESYAEWFAQLANAPTYAVSASAIRNYWQINREHPPVNKIWNGFIWSATRGFFDDLTAHRFGNILLVGLLIGTLYLTVASGFGRLAGLAATLLLLSMPRFFFHAHLAALDMPAAVGTLLVTVLFWHTRNRHSAGWDVALGLLWGLALASKINAAFVLPTLLLWMLLFARSWRLAIRLAVTGVIGTLVFFAVWPWLYHDTGERLVQYIRFITVDHWEIGQWYLGEWHMPPPWHFAFVMAAAVTPLSILVLAALGSLRAITGTFTEAHEPEYDRTRQAWLWLLSAVVPLAALAIGQTRVYDNERLFMPFFPFAAALAAAGLHGLTSAVQGFMRREPRTEHQEPNAQTSVARTRSAPLIGTALLLIALIPQTSTASVLYPHLLSYYSETVGGLPGAVRMNLETTYWCETYAAALPYLNAEAPPGAVIWAEDWSHDVLLYYQSIGWLRPDLRVAMVEGAGTILAARGVEGITADINEADYAIIMHRQTGFAVHPEIQRFMRNRIPVLRVERFGVPLMEVYRTTP